jgi:hypothetical protein
MRVRFLLLQALGLVTSLEVVGRRAMLLRATAAATGSGSAAAVSAATWENPFAPADRSGLKNRPLETLRIMLQDEADAIQYGGQEGLAPGGAPPATGLTLIPILRMRERLKALQPSLSEFDGARWAAVAAEISAGDFRTVDFKRVFNAFSDNIYYTSGTDEANAYLLGGATPSNAQTTQYLLRNEALKQIDELRDEIRFQQQQPSEKREVDVAQEAMAAALKAFDDYLKLAPPDQLATARTALDLH